MMNVEELIKQLQKIPSNTKVVIRGYEDGFNDIKALKCIKIKHNSNSEWYNGEYLEDESSYAVEAIELFGENTNRPNV